MHVTFDVSGGRQEGAEGLVVVTFVVAIITCVSLPKTIPIAIIIPDVAIPIPKSSVCVFW